MLGLQAAEEWTKQSAKLDPLWSFVVTLLIFGGLISSMTTAALKRGAKVASGFFSVSWLLGMASWPLAVNHTPPAVQDRPWLWYLCAVATAAAAVAWPPWLALLALIFAPLCFGLVRILPSGGGAHWEQVGFDLVYVWLLGATILGIITMLRQAASTIDAAQAAALEKYSRAVRRHATELQRSNVDAIVHDNVLATLLAANHARTPESRLLATDMAVDALAFLRDAALAVPGDGPIVSLASLVERIALANGSLGAAFAIQSRGLHDQQLSEQTSEAIFAATLQAMSNSVQHAGDNGRLYRWVKIRGRGDGGCLIEVGDTGRGFLPPAVPSTRIGLRVSIIERISHAGGSVSINSKPGKGTLIAILWPANRPPEGPETTRDEVIPGSPVRRGTFSESLTGHRTAAE